MGSQPKTAATWLVEHGPQELESLFRAVVYHPSAPILITDENGKSREASVGVAKLLGLSREKIIGRPVVDFADPSSRAQIAQLANLLREKEEHVGTLKLLGPNARPHEVEFKAKANILPALHVVALRDKTDSGDDKITSWVQDYALYLLDTEGRVAAWFCGAARIYGLQEKEILGQHVSRLYPDDESLPVKLQEELQRATIEGHFGKEDWHTRKDGTRFWANAITMALRDQKGVLQGFARVVRDFTDRHERDEKLRHGRARLRPVPGESRIAGIVSGEFDLIQEANDTFLDLVGYSRGSLVGGLLHWPDLSPAEYAPLDELAHEEGLRFGACTPYAKELLRKDGTRVPVLFATSVLKLSPFRWITFVQDLRGWDELETVAGAGEDDGKVTHDFDEMVGNSAALKRIQRQIEMVAPTDATVLILGETGTGKELVARAVHRMSPRARLPFITLNCAAIPTGLLESELFGYERGAFTGALTQKIGRFEMAHHGTLFLDEVGDIPLDLQPKLLRALQEKAFERLGGTKTIPIDVRLVAATNRNLTQMMGEKLFRSDLYYRLRVFPITTPRLCDRPEDIPLLVRFFVAKYAAKMGRQIDKIPFDTMQRLVAWGWPGNIRELENFMERAVILSSGGVLRAPLEEIQEEVQETATTATLEQVEREHIIRVLRECDGVVTKAATRLGLHRTTLNAMMLKLGISRRDI